jgi:hypothetical protein
MRSRDRHTLLARPLVGLHISHTPFLVQNRHSPLGSGHFNHLLLNSVVCLYRGKVTGNQGSSSKYRGFHGFPVFKNHVELAKELWDSYSLPNISQLLGAKGLDFSSEASLGPRRARARAPYLRQMIVSGSCNLDHELSAITHTHTIYIYHHFYNKTYYYCTPIFVQHIYTHKKYVLHFRSRSGSQWINQPPSLEIKERPTRRFPAKYHQRIASSSQSTKVAVRGPKIAIRTSIGWWGRWIQIKIDSKSISENQ